MNNWIWDLIKAGLAILLTAVGWTRIEQHGAEREKRKQAEQEVKDAQARQKAAEVPDASPKEMADILRRMRARRERLRDKKDGGQ